MSPEGSKLIRPSSNRASEFFHGTTEHLEPGDVVAPGGGPLKFPQETNRRYAYATPSEDNAWNYAEKAFHASDSGHPRVYQVEPLGRHTRDPEYDRGGNSRGNFRDDRRSKAGWKVVGERKMPESMGNPDDWR